MKKNQKIDKKSVRLTNHVSPINYNLTIFPDILSGTFSGKEIITIKIDKEIKEITLHSKDLDIETVKYITNKEEQFAKQIKYNAEKETVTFNFANKINKGQGKLSIIFSGIINDSLRGFYKSKYTLEGKEKFIATTQFEATDARRAFPCFDEPAHKAVFEISLIIPNNHTAISNTLPINIREHGAGYNIVSFAPTPKMSTYLLAFIIGEFEYIEGKTREGVQVRVFTTSGKKHQAKFALDVAIKSLEFYNDYFDIPYPLPTLDLIAIPDFESGAMENWGAVTFRETALLVDEENSSLSNKQWVALVISHELAHQWFGNLVTMHWWTDLWLNEGFASYIEYLAIDKIFPSWKVWNQFLTMDHNIALGLDGLQNSHPIEVTVHHPNEINEIFDKISYSKGASIIRMLAEYIGQDKFKEGLRYYLKKHSYKNTETLQLWKALEKISKKPVSKMMNSWTKQVGYPLVTLSHRSDLWELRQERFFSSRISRKNNKIKSSWQIPISYNNENILIDKKINKLQKKIMSKINEQETSFLRVNYDDSILENIKTEIKNNHLSTIDRLGIIRDIFANAEGGYITTDKALEFSLVYKDETEYIVWSEIASSMNKIFNLIHDEPYKNKFMTYALSMFSPLALRMGFNKKANESHHDVFLRNLAISQAGFYGNKEVMNEAQKLWNNMKSRPIDADIRGAVYNIIARNGDSKTWGIFKRMFKQEKLHEEKDRLSRALTQFTDKNMIEKTLEFIMSKEVRSQDAPHLLVMAWQNKEGRDLTWRFIKTNWKIILKKYGEGGHFLSRLFTPLGNHTKLSDLKDAKKFFSKNAAPGAERTLEQAYERITSNAAWFKDDSKSIKNWLEKNF